MNPLFLAGTQATKHAILRTLSVLCVLAVCAFLWFAVNRVLNPKETSKTVQSANIIQNIENLPKQDIRHAIKSKLLWGAIEFEIF